MIKTDFLREYKKKQYYSNMIKNRLKKQRLYNKQLREYNKNNKVYNFGIDKVYELANLHKKINWFRYYLEVYFVDLLNKHNNIKNNKINLK